MNAEDLRVAIDAIVFDRARLSGSPRRGASRARSRIILGCLLVSAIATPAIANDERDDASLVIIPIECTQFAPIVLDPTAATGWNNVLSFAGCIQDASMVRVDRADQLDTLVEQMQDALEPAVAYYAAAIEYGPGPVKVRAAYQVGSGLVALITRARASIVAPPDLATPNAALARYHELHARLEPLLEPHARLAWLIFVTIEHAVDSDPEIASDVVTSNMMRSARELAVQLGRTLSTSPDDNEPRTVWPTFMSSTFTSKSQIAGSTN